MQRRRKEKKAPLRAALNDMGMDDTTQTELSFSAAVFVALVLILAHYAFFMSRLMYANLSYPAIGVHAALLVGHMALLGYLLGKVVYPKLYKKENNTQKKNE